MLGSINLAAFVDEHQHFKYDDFKHTVNLVIKALNDVLDESINAHPLQVQRDIAHDWRNCGLGIMGLADMLIKMGIKYDSDEAVALSRSIAKQMATQAIIASNELARHEGAFPKCRPELISNSPFIRNLHLDEDTSVNITKFGLRNCALLTIAPTGTLSNMIGVSGGIEPIYANSYTRKTESLNNGQEPVYYKVYTPIVKEYMEKHGIAREEELPSYFVTALHINPHKRIDMQAAWQEYIDASISSTLNLAKETTPDEIFELYLEGWQKGLKGMTVFRDQCDRVGVLTNDTPHDAEDTSPTLKRGEIIRTSPHTIGLQRKLITGCGSLYCQAFFDYENGELRQFYLSKGSTGGCNNFMIGLSRMISLSARSGVKIDDIIDQLLSTGVCPSYSNRAAESHDTSRGSCCPMAIGYALKDMYNEFKTIHITRDEAIKEQPAAEPKQTVQPTVQHVSEIKSEAKCPSCGEPLIKVGGCNSCPNCGWSRCG